MALLLPTYISLLLCVLLNISIIKGVNNNPKYRQWGYAQAHNNPWGNKLNQHWHKLTKECVVEMKNATFNLLPLYLNPDHPQQLKYYSVKDERNVDDPTDDYKYAFNVCGAVNEIPQGCTESDFKTYEQNENRERHFCDNNTLQTFDNGTTICTIEWSTIGGEAVYAYQMKIDSTGGEEKVTNCWHLSDTTGGPGKWSLINEDNPSEGVVVTYIDGDYDEFCGYNRQVDINFVCDNDHGAYGIPGESSSEVDYTLDDGGEPALCQYKLEFHTVYGCPSECPIVGNKICNGVGLCGYDWTIEQPRCYCYSWFKGDSCSEFDVLNVFKPKHDPATADLSKEYVKQFNHILPDHQKKNHNVTVTYDLEEFVTEPNKPYIMRDVDGYGAYRRTYVWGFMNEIDMDIVVSNRSNKTLRDYGCHDHTGYCKDLSQDCTDDKNLGTGEGYVYQIDEYDESCIMVGGKNISWSLYDDDNPARGVILNFKNGDFCRTVDGVSYNRNFQITLICPDDSNSYIKLSEESKRIFDAFIEEDNFVEKGSIGSYDFCNYHVTITSAFACPDECLTDVTDTERPDDVSVCSTQGMCASDPFSGYVHCLCDDGWAGDFCDEVYVEPLSKLHYKNQGAYIAAFVILSLLIIGICYFGYKKISEQKQKVKELEIKLVNYQSSGGAATFHDDERPPQIEDMPQSKGPSLSDKIKNKFGGRNKRGKYSNISSQNDDDEEEAELFNVKVKMNGGHSDDDEDENEENDDDAGYNKPKQNQYEIGDEEDDDDDEEEDDSEDGNEDDK